MTILAFFSEYGEPKTGLTPTVTVRDLLSNTIVVNDLAMIEKGEGFYTYEFSNLQDRSYSWIADAGLGATNKLDQFTYGDINPTNPLQPVMKFN